MHLLTVLTLILTLTLHTHAESSAYDYILSDECDGFRVSTTQPTTVFVAASAPSSTSFSSCPFGWAWINKGSAESLVNASVTSPLTYASECGWSPSADFEGATRRRFWFADTASNGYFLDAVDPDFSVLRNCTGLELDDESIACPTTSFAGLVCLDSGSPYYTDSRIIGTIRADSPITLELKLNEPVTAHTTALIAGIPATLMSSSDKRTLLHYSAPLDRNTAWALFQSSIPVNFSGSTDLFGNALPALNNPNSIDASVIIPALVDVRLASGGTSVNVTGATSNVNVTIDLIVSMSPAENSTTSCSPTCTYAAEITLACYSSRLHLPSIDLDVQFYRNDISLPASSATLTAFFQLPPSTAFDTCEIRSVELTNTMGSTTVISTSLSFLSIASFSIVSTPSQRDTEPPVLTGVGFSDTASSSQGSTTLILNATDSHSGMSLSSYNSGRAAFTYVELTFVSTSSLPYASKIVSVAATETATITSPAPSQYTIHITISFSGKPDGYYYITRLYLLDDALNIASYETSDFIVLGAPAALAGTVSDTFPPQLASFSWVVGPNHDPVDDTELTVDVSFGPVVVSQVAAVFDLDNGFSSGVFSFASDGADGDGDGDSTGPANATFLYSPSSIIHGTLQVALLRANATLSLQGEYEIELDDSFFKDTSNNEASPTDSDDYWNYAWSNSARPSITARTFSPALGRVDTNVSSPIDPTAGPVPLSITVSVSGPDMPSDGYLGALYVVSPAGQYFTVQIRAEYRIVDDRFAVPFTLPHNAAAGTWDVQAKEIGWDGTEYRRFSSSADHQAFLSTAIAHNFEVAEGGDNTPPQLIQFRFETTGTVILSHTPIVFFINATDPCTSTCTGIAFAGVIFTSQDGNSRATFYRSIDEASGPGWRAAHISVIISDTKEDLPEGTWNVDSILIFDNAGNIGNEAPPSPASFSAQRAASGTNCPDNCNGNGRCDSVNGTDVCACYSESNTSPSCSTGDSGGSGGSDGSSSGDSQEDTTYTPAGNAPDPISGFSFNSDTPVFEHNSVISVTFSFADDSTASPLESSPAGVNYGQCAPPQCGGSPPTLVFSYVDGFRFGEGFEQAFSIQATANATNTSVLQVAPDDFGVELQVNFTFPATATPGTWRLTEALLYDLRGNFRQMRSDSIDERFGRGASFYIIQAPHSNDWTAPTVSSIRRTLTNDTLSYNIRVLDNDGGTGMARPLPLVNSFGPFMLSIIALGTGGMLQVPIDETNRIAADEYQIALPLDEFPSSGIFLMITAGFYDAAFNRVQLTPDDLFGVAGDAALTRIGVPTTDTTISPLIVGFRQGSSDRTVMEFRVQVCFASQSSFTARVSLMSNYDVAVLAMQFVNAFNSSDVVDCTNFHLVGGSPTLGIWEGTFTITPSETGKQFLFNYLYMANVNGDSTVLQQSDQYWSESDTGSAPRFDVVDCGEFAIGGIELQPAVVNTELSSQQISLKASLAVDQPLPTEGPIMYAAFVTPAPHRAFFFRYMAAHHIVDINHNRTRATFELPITIEHNSKPGTYSIGLLGVIGASNDNDDDSLARSLSDPVSPGAFKVVSSGDITPPVLTSFIMWDTDNFRGRNGSLVPGADSFYIDVSANDTCSTDGTPCTGRIVEGYIVFKHSELDRYFGSFFDAVNRVDVARNTFRVHFAPSGGDPDRLTQYLDDPEDAEEDISSSCTDHELPADCDEPTPPGEWELFSIRFRDVHGNFQLYQDLSLLVALFTLGHDVQDGPPTVHIDDIRVLQHDEPSDCDAECNDAGSCLDLNGTHTCSCKMSGDQTLSSNCTLLEDGLDSCLVELVDTIYYVQETAIDQVAAAVNSGTLNSTQSHTLLAPFCKQEDDLESLSTELDLLRSCSDATNGHTQGNEYAYRTERHLDTMGFYCTSANEDASAPFCPVFVQQMFEANDTASLSCTDVAAHSCCWRSALLYFEDVNTGVVDRINRILDECSIVPGTILPCSPPAWAPELNVTVLDINPAPKLSFARLTNAATRIRLVFDVDTDRAGATTTTVSCASILTDATVSLLGSTPKCTWVTTSTLAIDIDATASVLVGQSLRVRDNVLRTAEGVSLTSLGQSAVLQAPETPPTVSAVISAPLLVGACDDIELDGTLSTGNAGRTLAYAWALVSANKSSLSNAEIAAINSDYAPRLARSSLSVPASRIPSGDSFTFQLRVLNWLGSASTATVTVVKAAEELPRLTISGSLSRQARRDQALLIAAQAEVSPCSQASALAYTWQQATQLTAAERAQFGSVSLNGGAVTIPVTSRTRPTLYLAARTLTAGRNYAFRVSVTMRNSSNTGSNHATVLVQVASSPLVAKISGGGRLLSRNSDSPALALDASSSTDPDVSNAGVTGMSFVWTCARSVFGAACFNTTVSTALRLGQTVAAAASGALLTVPAGYFGATDGNDLYRFSVRVTKDTRAAEASTSIRTTLEVVPSVFITPLTTTKHNPNSRLILRGRSSNAAFSHVWSSSSNFNMSDTQLLGTPRTSQVLVIRAGALEGGADYEFTLSVTDPSTGRTGTASIDVTTNLPPASGSCSASPQNGTAFNTTFSLSCADWTDDADDLPLQYSFVLVDQSTGVVKSRLRVFQQGNSFRAQLPQGRRLFNYRQHVRGIVQDALGAQTSVDFFVYVSPPNLAEQGGLASFTNNVLTNSLAAATEEGDTDKFLTLVVSTTELLESDREDSGNSSTAEQTQERREVRKRLYSAVIEVSNSTYTSTESLVQQVQMMSQVASAPDELDASLRQDTVDFVRTRAQEALDNDDVEFVPEMATAVVEALESVATSSAQEVRSSGGNDTARDESQAIAESFDGTIALVARGQLQNLEVGEEPAVIRTERMLLSNQRNVPTGFNGASIGDDEDDPTAPAFGLPSDMFGSGDALDSTFVIFDENLYEWAEDDDDDSPSLSPLVTLDFKDANGTAVNVENLATPIRITIPHLDGADNVLVDEEIESVCRFYNATARAWSTNGCTHESTEMVGDTLVTTCLCTHLTSFNVRREDVTPTINTLSAEDFVAINWDNIKEHPSTAVAILVVFGLYLLILPCARRRDRRARAKVYATPQKSPVEEVNLDEEENETMWEKLKHRVKDGFVKDHIWVSIIVHEEDDSFNSTQRLTVLLVLIFTAMTINAAFFGNGETLGADLAITVISSVLSLPVSILVEWIFAKAGPLPAAERQQLLKEWRRKIRKLRRENEAKQRAAASNRHGEIEMGPIVEPNAVVGSEQRQVPVVVVSPAPDVDNAESSGSASATGSGPQEGEGGQTGEQAQLTEPAKSHLAAPEVSENARSLSSKYEAEIEEIPFKEPFRLHIRWKKLAYVFSFVWVAGCAVLMLAYGLQFDRQQEELGEDGNVSDRWLISSALSNVQDAIINRPLSILLSSIFAVAIGEAVGACMSACGSCCSC